MTNAKHTPGPWELDDNRRGSHVYVHAKTHGALATVVWQMAQDYREGKPSPECEANARLIAAAPELLNALKDILEHCHFEKKDLDSKRNVNEFRVNAVAAIAKATGQAA